MIVRPATDADAPEIAGLLNAFLATTTIEWTDTPGARTAFRSGSASTRRSC